MAVHHHILGAQANKPTMGLVQDALTGIYLMTRKNVFLTKDQVMSLMMTIKYEVPYKSIWKIPCPAVLRPIPLWTGKQLVSLLIPPLFLERRVRGADKDTSIWDDKERVVMVREGNLVLGSLCKSTVGIASGNIVHVMALDYGGQITCNFLSDVQRMINAWLLIRGFSVGLSDCTIDKHMHLKIQKKIRKSIQKVDKIYTQLKKISNLPGDAAEPPVFRTLSEVLNATANIVSTQVDDSNRIYCMINAGSKGNPINMSQIAACVGQQSVEGRRIQPKKNNRTLAAFSSGSVDPRSRGFVTSSYTNGLKPTEFFFHGMGGREGLVDTAVKTADTGYLQRRMMKAMESLRVHYDQTVRDSKGMVLDFCYGGDGLDATFLDSKTNLPFLEWSKEKIQLYVCGGNKELLTMHVFQDQIDCLLTLRDECIHSKLTDLVNVLDMSVFLPMSLPRVIKHAKMLVKQMNKALDNPTLSHVKPHSPQYAPNPTSPQYAPNPTSPQYAPNPTSPQYAPNPTSPQYAPNPTSPQYAPNPTSPQYAPTDDPWLQTPDPPEELKQLKLSEELDLLNQPVTTSALPPDGTGDSERRPYGSKDVESPREPLTHEEVWKDVKSLMTQIGVNSLYMRASLAFELASWKLLNDDALTREEWNSTRELIRYKWERSRAQPGEMVGALSAESVGEGNTQGTLNSVIGEEKLLLCHLTQGTRVATIGSFVDLALDQHSSDVQHISENRTEFLALKEPWYVTTAFNDGTSTWKKITGVTRHLPLGELVKITTRSGRSVTMTEQKSALVWNTTSNSFVPTNGCDLQVGMLVPTVFQTQPPPVEAKVLDLVHYLPKTKWIYGTDFNKAREIYELHRTKRYPWFKENQGKSFTLPYSRADSLSEAFNNEQLIIKSGFVYPKFCHRVVAQIPEKFTLDEEFGWIVGIYLAEGWCTDTFMGISNNEVAVLNRVRAWCDKLHVTHHTVESTNARFPGSKSTDLKIHSVLLARFFKLWCKTGSASKRVPNEAFSAPLDFCKGILNGYWTGDGTIALDYVKTGPRVGKSRTPKIEASSASEELILGMLELCSRLGIYAQMDRGTPNVVHKHKYQAKSNNVRSSVILPTYTISINSQQCYKFARSVGCFAAEKHRRLQECVMQHDYQFEFGQQVEVANHTILDPIINITRIKPSNPFVYDLSVEETLNFCTLGGLVNRDTFHAAGIASKNVTLGVPRLKELLDVAKNMKIPSLTIFLKPMYNQAEDMVTTFARSLERTCLEDVVVDSDVVWEPDFFKTKYAEDQELLDMSRPFYSHIVTSVNTTAANANANPTANSSTNPTAKTFHSSWVIRIKLHKHLLLTRQYTSFHVMDAIQSFVGDKAYVWCSPPEQSSWMVRIRLCDIKGAVEKLDAVRSKQTDRALTYALQTLLVKNVIIGGIKDIERATPRQITSTRWVHGNLLTQREWVIDTEGSILGSVGIIPSVDWFRTYSNDISEVWEILGLEAAIQVLFNELKTVLSFDGSTINDRHIMMIVNTMTYRGTLMAFNRFGFNRQDDASVLGRSSFEEPMEILLEGAMFGQHDALRGVSERIMVGRRADIGTNSFGKRNATKIFQYRQKTIQTWRTRVSAAWIPWDQPNSTSSTSRHSHHDSIALDSPPPSPVIRAMDTKVEEIHHAQHTYNTHEKPFSQDVMSTQPTKGASIVSLEHSPVVSPMLPSHYGYQLDANYFTLDHRNSKQSSTSLRHSLVLSKYKPSSPNMDENDVGSTDGLATLLVYRPSSPDFTTHPIHPVYTPPPPPSVDPPVLSSDEICNLLDSLEQKGYLVPPSSGNFQPSEQDLNRLQRDLDQHIQNQTFPMDWNWTSTQ